MVLLLPVAGTPRGVGVLPVARRRSRASSIPCLAPHYTTA